jgi:hypothetical protein
MTRTYKKALVGLLAAPVLAFSALLVAPVSPALAVCDTTNPSLSSGADCAQPTGAATTLFGQGSIFTTVVNILLFAIGIIAVIMLILGGIRYTVSGGEAKAVESAKNTILYAIIGIVVAFLAYAVVNWVLTSLTANTA